MLPKDRLGLGLDEELFRCVFSHYVRYRNYVELHQRAL
jgi:hypothetical protein